MEVLEIKFENWYFEKLIKNEIIFLKKKKLSPKDEELRVRHLACGGNTLVGDHAWPCACGPKVERLLAVGLVLLCKSYCDPIASPQYGG